LRILAGRSLEEADVIVESHRELGIALRSEADISTLDNR